uniref:Uncharacterized protein n=1 Tax=Physcomitrium patens TaxID=3218 RepID=A0A2K1IGV0_PHYPA|nr:hypothetical protein PHYPA_029097 [Physcomitrium patens]
MRKFIISNIGLIGCASSVLSQRSKTGECTEEVNNYAIGFNVALKPRLESLGAELSNSIFLYTNAYDVLKAIIDKPLQHDKSKKFKTGLAPDKQFPDSPPRTPTQPTIIHHCFAFRVQDSQILCPLLAAAWADTTASTGRAAPFHDCAPTELSRCSGTISTRRRR